jgi:hypothetical protein
MGHQSAEEHLQAGRQHSSMRHAQMSGLSGPRKLISNGSCQGRRHACAYQGSATR